MTPARHIGIVAVSAEGAALCYRTICLEGASLFGPHGHPEITMHSHSLAEYMRHVEAGQWDAAGQLLLASAKKAVKAGADFLVCPDNTLHQALDVVRAESPAPWLHIAEEVAVVAAKNHFLRLGILGTRYLMEGPVYPAKCRKWDMSCEVPDVPDRTRINSIIFDELVLGELKEDSRKYFQTVIEKLRMRGCDAVVLGCTEIPLLISESDSSLPVIESTRTLALAALREAMVSTAASQA